MKSVENQNATHIVHESSVHSDTGRTSIHWFYAFFFISGFCSLVYEVVWLRLAMAKFGVTTPMVSVVLSVFMAGLGLGSYAGGIYIRRFSRSSPQVLLRLYGILELAIGCSGLLAPLIIDAGYRILRDAKLGLAWGSSAYYFLSGAWILISLLPWCTCMGATFPFAMAAIRKLWSEDSGHSFSYLYLANVLGAVFGTLVPAFVLIELLGFSTTLHLASAANASLAIAVFLLSSNLRLPASMAETDESVSAEWSRSRSARTAMVLLFTTGFCSMAMEVVWIRQFTAYLGNLVYAFAIILAVYLIATFVGSYVYRKGARLDESDVIGSAWIGLGLVSLLPLLLSDPRLPIPEPRTVDSLAFGAIRAVIGIAPFSGFVGFITPMLVDRYSRGNPDRAGKAYSINVVGSILGPLAAGFFVLPLAGERWGLVALSLPLFVVGCVGAFRSSQMTTRKVRPATLYVAAALISVILILTTKDFGTRFSPRIELRDYTATVIATGQGMKKRLLVNGTGMTKLTPITKMMAHLPLAFLERSPKNALVICFGMGTTFRSMMSWGINVTAVELVPSVPALFGYFHPDGPELLRSPNAHLVIDDGRRFLERSGEQYDVIAIDPPPPTSAPTSSLLYSEEFYSIIKRHLRPGGILQVWCPGGDPATMAAITKALFQSFPHVVGFESFEDWGLHFLVSMQPIPDLEPQDLAKRMPANAARDLVELNEGKTPVDMFGKVLDNEVELEDFITSDPTVPAMTDDRPINEYFLLRSAGFTL